VTINIPGDRSIAPSSGSSSTVETTQSSRVGTHGSPVRSNGVDDHISVSSSTANIQSKLDDLSVARSAKVAKLAQLFASGRYTPDSSAAAGSLVDASVSAPASDSPEV
jgi:flagellar biosynthesis anti-sigma factor FlgM